MKGLKLVAILLVVVAIGGGLWAYWRYSTLYPSTQDAYVQANVVTIAAEVTGKVTAVHVSENQHVAAGDPLFDLDDAVYRNAVTQAQAQVESASEATGSYSRQIEATYAAVESATAANDAAQAQLVRVQTLFNHGNAAQLSLDQAHSAAAQSESSLRAAQAQMAQARAALVANRDTLVAAQAILQTARLSLDRTKVTAPVDGWVSNLSLREGTVVTAYPVIEAGYLFIPRGLAAGFSMVLTGAVLVSRFDPRVLAAIGLILTASSNFATGALNLNASFWQLAWPGIIGGMGMGLVFVPMSTLAFDRVDSARQDGASGLYGVTRQLGSSIGIAIVGAMVVRGLAMDTALLTQHVTPYSTAARAYLAPLGLSPQSTEGAAILSGEIARQAALMSYVRVFDMLGWVATALLPILLVMRRPTHIGGAPMAH